MKNVISLATILALSSLTACEIPATDAPVDSAAARKAEGKAPTSGDLAGIPMVEDMPEGTVCIYPSYDWDYGSQYGNKHVGLNKPWQESDEPLSFSMPISSSDDCREYLGVANDIEGITRILEDQGYANQFTVECVNNLTNEIYPGYTVVKPAKMKVTFLQAGVKFGGQCAYN